MQCFLVKFLSLIFHVKLQHFERFIFLLAFRVGTVKQSNLLLDFLTSIKSYFEKSPLLDRNVKSNLNFDLILKAHLHFGQEGVDVGDCGVEHV